MKLAILGTGNIIEDALTAISEVKEIEKAAILARPKSIEKGEDFARRFNIKKVYTDYDELLADDEIDTVYVGLINSVHYSYTKQALLAGKNAIVEKPFCPTYEESKELFDLAKEKGLFIFDAVTPRHSEVFEKMKEFLPKLGQIRGVQGNYSQYSSRYERYLNKDIAPAFDPKAFGGALHDLGIYNLNIVVALLGKPENVRYDPNCGFNGVDVSGFILLRYPGFLASLMAAKDADSPGFLTIQGENGWIKIPGKPNEVQALDYCIDGEKGHFDPKPLKNRMTQEFIDFERIVREADRAEMEHEMTATLSIIQALEQARKSSGIEYGG